MSPVEDSRPPRTTVTRQVNRLARKLPRGAGSTVAACFYPIHILRIAKSLSTQLMLMRADAQLQLILQFGTFNGDIVNIINIMVSLH